MVKNIKLEIKNNKFGQIALLLTLVILAAVLSIGVGLTLIIIKEIRIAKNVEESAKALSAANAGMEYALYKTEDFPGLDEPLDRLCPPAGPAWISLSNNSEYCLEYTGSDAANPESITSYGKFGDVRRAILLSSSVDDLDQFNVSATIYYDEEEDYCSYSGWVNCCCIGRNLGQQKVAQTFQSDTTGPLTRITVWSGACWDAGVHTNPAIWQIELRDVDGLGKPGPNLLAESNNITIPVCANYTCYELDFYFDSSDPSNQLGMVQGQKYSFVVKEVAELREHVYVRSSREAVYLSGRNWYWNGSDWMADCTFINPLSDLGFKVFISPSFDGTFEETKP